MNKKIALLWLATLLLASGAVPALAAGPRTAVIPDLPGTQYFTMVGFITVKGTDSLDVDAIHGNRFTQPLIGGGDVTVQKTSATELRRWAIVGFEPIAWDDINEGDTVSIHGDVVGGELVATRVTIGVPLDCCTP